MTDPLLNVAARFTPAQLTRARAELAADTALYQSFIDAGMTEAQASAEMVKRGHGERYVTLLARRIAPVAKPTPKAGKPEKVNSMDDGKPVDPASMQWFLAAETDPQTGLAKWPLSFKRIEKDVKRPGKPANPTAARPGDQKPEQPPLAVG